MALTVEDGTEVSGADSFSTVAEFDTEVTGLFGAADSQSDVLKEAALRRSFLYLKSLSWKSDYPFPVMGGTIPPEVKQAQSVLAHYEVANPSGLQPSVVPGQQKVLNRVGEIGWKVTGSSGSSSQRAVVTMAADLLKPFTNDNGNTSFIDRA